MLLFKADALLIWWVCSVQGRTSIWFVTLIADRQIRESRQVFSHEPLRERTHYDYQYRYLWYAVSGTDSPNSRLLIGRDVKVSCTKFLKGVVATDRGLIAMHRVIHIDNLGLLV